MSGIVLFYSKRSPHSRNALEIVRQHGIKASLVCVDSQAIRSIIKNSGNYRIRGVPTLFVTEGSKLSIFEGEKVYNWLLNLVRGPEEVQEQQHNQNLDFQEETPLDDDQEPLPPLGPKTLKNPTGESVKDIALRLRKEAETAMKMNYE